jgi:type I restriction enzyme S subunit
MITEKKTIGELFTWVKGKRPTRLFDNEKEETIPYLSASYFRTNKPDYYASVNDKNCVLVDKDEIVLIWDGSNAGDVFCGLQGALSSTMVKFNKSEKCLSNFLYYLLVKNFRNLNKRTTGSTIPHVNGSALKEIEIPINSIADQQSVIKILSTVQSAISGQEALFIKLKELKRSMMLFLFAHGTKGEKTKMTEIGEIPNSWGTVELGKLIMKAQYGLSKKGNNTGTNPILRMTNQNDGYIALEKLQYVELSSSELEKFEIQSGDIIFNRTNSIDLVGRTAIYTHNQKGVVFASYLIRIRTDENKLLPEFFNFYMNTEATQRRLKDLATRGVSQSNISATRLTTLKIQLPTINEQREITEALKEVDQKIAVTREKLLSYQNLFRTLLHELMNGERKVKI